MSLTIQFQTMLLMTAAGVWVGLILDTYRRFFNRNKRAQWLVFLFDIIFWGVQALLIFYILLHVNHGQLRFYIFLAILCGFSAYQALFRGIYLTLLEKIIKICVSLYRVIKKMIQVLLIKPMIAICKIIVVFLLFLGRLLWKLVFIIYSIVFFPFRILGRLIWRIFPQKIKKFMFNIAGKVVVLKNKLRKWIARIRS